VCVCVCVTQIILIFDILRPSAMPRPTLMDSRPTEHCASYPDLPHPHKNARPPFPCKVSVCLSVCLPVCLSIYKKVSLGICIAPTQPFRAALGAESRVCYLGNTADRQTLSAHVLPPLAFNCKSEHKVNSLPPLGFEPVIFGMLAHLSDHSFKFSQISSLQPYSFFPFFFFFFCVVLPSQSERMIRGTNAQSVTRF
jgi:hypothetical protein